MHIAIPRVAIALAEAQLWNDFLKKLVCGGNKKGHYFSVVPFNKGWRRLTLPPVKAVPSARPGLTALFGMERGGPRRNNHHIIFGLQLPGHPWYTFRTVRNDRPACQRQGWTPAPPDSR